MQRSSLLIGFTLFVLVFSGVFFWYSSLPTEFTFQDDAGEYNAGAASLVQHGMYSLDGETPTMEREPGYSVFLAIIYLIFGLENRSAIFLIQAVLYLTAVFVFVRELKHVSSDRIAQITFFFLLLTPSVFRILFSVYRESLALSLFLIFMTLLLHYKRLPSLSSALFSGLVLGCILLTYYPFVFFPIGLLSLAYFWKMKKQHVAILILVPYLFVGAWAYRNHEQFGQWSVAGSFRSVWSIYVRGEQAERVTGLEPVKCLWAEYVSRDWTGRSDACSFNALIHAQWPDNLPLGNEEQIKQESISKILGHFPNYVWFSIVDIAELHFPYVGGGWPFVYNALAALGMLLLYIGCALSLTTIWKREYAPFLLLMLYTTALFTLTDATPRYLMPVLFCYALCSAVGFARLFKR